MIVRLRESWEEHRSPKQFALQLWGELVDRRGAYQPLVEQVALAAVLVAVCLGLRGALDPVLHDRAPFLTVYLGVLLAAWFGGLTSGLTAVFLGVVFADLFFVKPRGSLMIDEVADAMDLALFATVGVAAAFITEAQRRAQLEAEQAIETAKARQRALETEIKMREQAEASVKFLVSELRRSNRELQDFAFVASHDLQEPLRKILAFGDRLAKKEAEALSPEGQDYLRRMTGAADRMQNLIHDLLEFSRVTSKAKPFAATDLNEVLDRVLDDLQGQIERTGGRVDRGDLPTLEADVTQMHQLFQNLVGNALKFAKPDVAPVVTISAARVGGDRWAISVADNGIGFDQKHADKIFTIFQRLHARQEYEGSGIGLSICRKIAERHGGAIQTRSQPGEGATFTITLPAHQPQGEKT
jgi:signal transduction histidine kinase